MSPPAGTPARCARAVGGRRIRDVEREVERGGGVAVVDAILALGRALVAFALLRSDGRAAEGDAIGSEHGLASHQAQDAFRLADDAVRARGRVERAARPMRPRDDTAKSGGGGEREFAFAGHGYGSLRGVRSSVTSA